MEEPDEFPGFSEPMPCFEARLGLADATQEGPCELCRKFLTTECEYIDHFLEEDEG